MKKNIFFILLFCFLLNSFDLSKSDCIYNNTIYGGIYNLTKLIRPENNPYSKSFQSGLSTYTLTFNFCNVSVPACGERACVDSKRAGSLYRNETVSYGLNKLTISYVTEKLNFDDCLAGGNYRHTNFYLNCDPTVEVNVVSVSENPLCTYGTTINSKYICRECLYNCSNHGNCDPFSGNCSCDSQTQGKGCEKSRLFISSSTSVTEETSGLISIYGYFGNITNKAKVLIGDSECKNPKVGPPNLWTTINCTVDAGTGTKNITFKDNGLETVGIDLFKYIPKVYECLNDCSNHGKCNSSTGICDCFKDYSGLDCSGELGSNNNSSTSVNNGSSIIGNQNVTYSINIYSLVEYDVYGTILNEYILYNKWNTTLINSTSNSITTYYHQFIPDKNCTLLYSIEEVKNQSKSYSFAGIDFKLDPNSIKITVSISNYNYESTLNFLQLRILSTVDGYDIMENPCKSNNTEINTNGLNNNYQASDIITISKDNKIFYGRFLPYMLSDNRKSTLSTLIVNKNSTSLMIGLNMPHCINQCLIDPDFSVLVSNVKKNNCESSKRKWFLPVVIIVPVVGAAFIVIISSILIKKYRTNLKIAAAALKPAKLNNLNNS